MTKFLFHGENHRDSRHNVQLCVGTEKRAGKSIRELDGQKLRPQDLVSTLATQDLFGQESVLIENMGSRPLSNDKKSLIKIVKEYEGNKTIILWEKKELTKAQVTALGNDVVAKISKVPALIFTFLDSLSPDNAKKSLELLHETAKISEDGFIFVMMASQIADLLIAKSGDSSGLNPWKKSRLITQAELWTESELLAVHDQLLTIDRNLKTGQTKLSYLDHLDLLFVGLLR